MEIIEVSSKNAGAVTITAAGVLITTLDMGYVRVGEIIDVQAIMLYTKGGVAGRCTLQVIKESGTGNFISYSDLVSSTGVRDGDGGVAAADVLNKSLSGKLKVTVAGTLTLGIYGYSVGSDSTVGAGAGQAYAILERR